MSKVSFKDICSVCDDTDEGVFVGINYDNGTITVSFPLGYHFENEAATREDIFLLIRTISENCEHTKSEIPLEARNLNNKVDFPMQAYLFLIRDFMERGYYKETEIQYKTAKRGKIDWPRTIKTQKPYIQDGNAAYLDFVTRKEQIDENQLTTLIHKYCVYESFEKMGWLFTDHMPEKPNFDFRSQENLCISVVRNKINSTFNDRNKQLFQNMYAMLSYLEDNESDTKFTFGTTDFEYVWERMVDRLYGESDKKKYFPPARWITNNDKIKRNAEYDLRPDTIMLKNNDEKNDEIYVLDSKYYKYCITNNSDQLPKAESINKQITYGEYIAEKKEPDKKVYNAFILPFDSKSDKFSGKFYTNGTLFYIGYATGDWKVSGKEYESILGILLDVKYLMQKSTEKDQNEIDKLAKFITEKYK